MPQLNTTIYFHEYGWMFFSFFFFYFTFLKYSLPYLLYWMKLRQGSFVYHLNFVVSIDHQIQESSITHLVTKLYRLILVASLLEHLGNLYMNKLNNQLSTSQVERTVLNLLQYYK